MQNVECPNCWNVVYLNLLRKLKEKTLFVKVPKDTDGTSFKFSDELLAELLDDLLFAVPVRNNNCMDELEVLSDGASHLRLRLCRNRRPRQFRHHVQIGKNSPDASLDIIVLLTYLRIN